MEKYNVFDCSIVELDKHHSNRKGNLTVVENEDTLPFNVKRVYYLYDVPGGEERGSHAHRDLSQLIIAASGSFRVTIDDGKCKRSFFLNRPYQGLYVRPGLWRNLDDFSSEVQSAWFLHPMSIRRLIILGIMKIFWNLGIRNKGSSSNLVVNFLFLYFRW